MNKQTHTNEWADEYISQKTNGKFIRVSEYINMDSPITLQCSDCGILRVVRFSRLRSKKRIRCLNCYDAEINKKREETRHIRLMNQEKKRIKKIKGTQITLRFCIDCNAVLDTERKRCKQCQKVIANKNHELRRRALIQHAIVDKDITIDKLIKKDKGICYLCGKECDCNDYVINHGVFIAGNYYPSIDHVIPLSKGGEHSWSNVRLAHRICNTIKGNKE